jgi:hypothetical protein
MTYIPVSTGIPALVRRKRSHVVNLIDERRIEFFRRIPYVILFIAAVIGNLAYVGAGPFEALHWPSVAEGPTAAAAASVAAARPT